MNKRTILFSLIGMFLIGAAVGAYLFMKPVTSIQDLKADKEISATSLFDEYMTSEEEANANFLGKVLEIDGLVREVREGEEGGLILVLETTDLIFGVICEFEVKPAAEDIPEAGDQVRIKGICNGLLMDVVLNKCMIIK